MTYKKSLVPLLAALLLIGAGCASSETAKPSDSSDVNTNGAATVSQDGGNAGLTTTVAMDDTWKSYVNKSLNFEFKWPTKGRYAPQWAVNFLDENDATLKDGCVSIDGGSSKKATVGDVEFCHSMTAAGAANSTDRYATKKGSKFIVITFTKTPPAGVTDFSWDDYRANLDQIVSTFKFNQ